ARSREPRLRAVAPVQWLPAGDQAEPGGRVLTRARVLGVALLVQAALLVGTLGAAGVARAAPPPIGPRAADDFRRSDPAEADLAPVAESSGLSRETAVAPRVAPLQLDDVLDRLA